MKCSVVGVTHVVQLHDREREREREREKRERERERRKETLLIPHWGNLFITQLSHTHTSLKYMHTNTDRQGEMVE